MYRKLMTLVIVVVLAALVAGVGFAQSRPSIVSSQPAGNKNAPTAPVNPDAVLWDQPTNYYNAIVDQCFPDFFACVYSADDFTLSSTWDIDTIFVDGTKGSSATGSLPQADSLGWYIYPDDGGKPAGYPGDGMGSEVWSFETVPTDPAVTITGADFDEVTLDVVAAQGSPITLAPGTYWLTFFPTLNFTNWGQWFWDTSATTNLSIAQLIDPANLFGMGWTTWTLWTTAIGDPSLHDAAFRLEGTGGGGPTMHVHDITLAQAGMRVTGTVLVYDDSGNPVGSADVTVDVTGPIAPRSLTRTTKANGNVRFAGPARTGTWQLCVSDIVKAGFTYDPGQNHETCDQITVP